MQSSSSIDEDSLRKVYKTWEPAYALYWEMNVDILNILLTKNAMPIAKHPYQQSS